MEQEEEEKEHRHVDCSADSVLISDHEPAMSRNHSCALTHEFDGRMNCGECVMVGLGCDKLGEGEAVDGFVANGYTPSAGIADAAGNKGAIERVVATRPIEEQDPHGRP